MNHYKVCVYAICKNEAQFVDRWMDSMSEADLVVVTDTGSEDDTVSRLRQRGAVVYEEAFRPWRFDNARNRSLEHVPQDVDICVCTDLDEVFLPGWRKALEHAWNDTATMGRYLYNWSLKPDGTPDVQFSYFKVHRRQGYQWVYPVHECLRYTGEGIPREVFINDMVLNHYPDPTKSRGNYLPLLELGVAENPADDRMNFYLGREYFFAGRWQDCIDTQQRYLSLPRAVWEEERCAAMRLAARSYNNLGNREASKRWFYRAVSQCPTMREPYVEFAYAAYGWKDWLLCLAMTEKALTIKEKSKTYINIGCAWDHTPDDLAAIAAWELGLKERAISHGQRALALAPDDARLAANLALMKRKYQQEQNSQA